MNKDKKNKDHRESELSDGIEDHPTTNYVETLMHLFKGNVGTGCYAMADAFKNGGLIFGPLMTMLISLICVHSQHVLLKCSSAMKDKYQLPIKPDYAETVEMCFASSSDKRWSKMAKGMKITCNIFICLTQLGFCSVYYLFISTNIQAVLGFYDYHYDIELLICFVTIPLLMTSMITKLKYLAPCSLIANICMVCGIALSFYYITQDLPPFKEQQYMANYQQLPIFFGIVLFAFEGIALVLPLQNAMTKPSDFDNKLGVLNVGMVIVTILFTIFGATGFWKYGENTKGSMTLNLPEGDKLAQFIKLIIAAGVGLGYSIQLFVPVQIMFPSVERKFKWIQSHPVIGELFFRALLVFLTFTVAVSVPNLGLLLSLIGAVACTVLAFVLPPILEFIVKSEDGKLNYFVVIKNSIILLFAFVGFASGGYCSIREIINDLIAKHS